MKTIEVRLVTGHQISLKSVTEWRFQHDSVLRLKALQAKGLVADYRVIATKMQ